ncbi:Hsp20/alpha crystallin family protein [Streptomyces sp. LMG1-1-1.1]|uniref:Hsp20/alpha crystallin family protein n=1 Tax=Streptomyces sp. LMG1-1-1.1 TaxID=3135245 RepID=UPI003466F00D
MTGDKAERSRRHSLLPDFNDWFNREFPGLPGWRPGNAAHSIPVEVSRGGGTYVLRAELPGVDPDDVAVTIDDDLVTVSAEHSESEEDKDHSEFRYGSFRRTVRLPMAVPAEDVDASYEDGILTVRVPMPEERTGIRRSIPVRRAGGKDGARP